MTLLFLYYRSSKEKVGGPGRLLRLVKCLGGEVIDTPIANEFISRNLAYYIFQTFLLLLVTIKNINKVARYNIVVFQPYSLPGSVIALLVKTLQRRRIIVDDVNFHSILEILYIRLFNKFIYEIWTSSIYTLSQFAYYFPNGPSIRYIFTPMLPRSQSSLQKLNLILFTASKSFKRYMYIAELICNVIAKDVPEYKFILVGSAAENLKNRCKATNVLVLGRVPDTVYFKFLQHAKYLIVFDTADFIYPGGTLIKIIDALEYQVYPIVSSQFKYTLPFLPSVYSIDEVKSLLSHVTPTLPLNEILKLYNCKKLRQLLANVKAS